MLTYACTCADVTLPEWKKLMRGSRRTSYKKLCQLIKKEIPHLYAALSLNLHNPYHTEARETDTHYILVHSAIEYFLAKNNQGGVK